MTQSNRSSNPALLFLLGCFFLGTLCSSASAWDILNGASLDVYPEKAQQNLENHVRNIRWGMSPPDVVQRESISLGQEQISGNIGSITLPLTFIAELPCSITYLFVHNGLSSIHCAFQQELFRLNKNVANYILLQDLLSRKYGSPLETQEIWHDEESIYKDDPDALGMAVAMGELSYSTFWNTGVTEISLTLQGKKLHPELLLHYKSTVFEEAETEAREESFLSQL